MALAAATDVIAARGCDGDMCHQGGDRAVDYFNSN